MRMRSLLVAAVAMNLAGSASYAASLPDPLPCKPCFIGELILEANPADPSGRTKVVADDLYFVDPAGLVWRADKGDVTDGASIPAILQPFIGQAFDRAFLSAAVIHDRYTIKIHRVRSWQATALMFYQALVVRGVDAIKAKTMYYAVYTFGPHWGELAAGMYCGKNCINALPGAGQAKTEFVEEPAEYSEMQNVAELKQIQEIIAAAEIRGEPLSLSALHQAAKARHAKNAFLAPPARPNDR